MPNEQYDYKFSKRVHLKKKSLTTPGFLNLTVILLFAYWFQLSGYFSK